MTFLQAILLGVIQGLTEFIPISSTAHLTLAGKLMGLVHMDNAAGWTEFIAILQLGTLAAVVVYFFNDLVVIAKAITEDILARVRGAAPASMHRDARMGWLLIAGTIPVGVIGLAFSHQIHGWFTKSTSVIISSLIGLALLLWLAERVARHIRSLEQLTVVDALIIGTAQAMALIPGSSRSGTTITAGLFLGFSREAAARFSFLLSIPAIFASGVYEFMKMDVNIAEMGYVNLAVGTVVAGVTGYASIAWLLKYLSRNSTMLFVWYRIALGVALALLVSSGHIQP